MRAQNILIWSGCLLTVACGGNLGPDGEDLTGAKAETEVGVSSAALTDVYSSQMNLRGLQPGDHVMAAPWEADRGWKAYVTISAASVPGHVNLSFTNSSTKGPITFKSGARINVYCTDGSGYSFITQEDYKLNKFTSTNPSIIDFNCNTGAQYPAWATVSVNLSY